MRNILIVDDEAKIVEILEKFFSIHGFAVTTASDAKSAMKTLEGKRRPEVIVLDAKMPGMSGEEFVQEIRRSGNKTPVILLTGSIHIPPGKTIYDRVLFKPIRLSELLSAVNDIAGHRSSSEKSGKDKR